MSPSLPFTGDPGQPLALVGVMAMLVGAFALRSESDRRQTRPWVHITGWYNR